jgi:hypothetical protein
MLDLLWPRLIQQESGGNPFALSPRGAFGVAQLMPDTAKDPGFGIRPFNPNVPGDNERMGKDYLRAMLARYRGDPARALVAYNWGPGNADNWNGDNSALPKETQNYVSTILGNKDMRGYRGQGAPVMPMMNQGGGGGILDPDLLAMLQGGGRDKGGLLGLIKDPSKRDMLLALGAGIASGSTEGWGSGIGKGLALAGVAKQNNREMDSANQALLMKMLEQRETQDYRSKQLEQGAERNRISAENAAAYAKNSGVSAGYVRGPDGKLTYEAGGPADPKVIAEQSLARGRGADVPQNVRSEAITADQAYTSLEQSLDDYKDTVKRTGNVFLPGADADEVSSKRTNIQLQMKELYKLGVLTGPDMELMDSLLFDPNTTWGVPSFNVSGRVESSVDRVKEMMRQLRNAKTKSIGLPDIPAQSKTPAPPPGFKVQQ